VLRRRARHRHLDPAGLALALAFVVAAGCRGDDAGDDGFSPGVAQPIAKLELHAEADRISPTTKTRVEAAADGHVSTGNDPPPTQVRRIVIGVVVPALEAEVRAIRALGAPAGDRARVEAIIAATERGIDQILADPVAVLDGPPPALRRAGGLARAYGSRECGVASR
jgi:hypothetical protein